MRALLCVLALAAAGCVPKINAACEKDSDCASGNCQNGFCLLASSPPGDAGPTDAGPRDAGPTDAGPDLCNNGVRDDGEADTDCGGTCGRVRLCRVNQRCAVSDDCLSRNCDCTSRFCDTLQCFEPRCGDGRVGAWDEGFSEACDDGGNDECGECNETCTGPGRLPASMCASICSASPVDGQRFNDGMVGCPGSVTWANRATLCPARWRACSAAQWRTQRGRRVPAYHYWTNDNLLWNGTGVNDCEVSLTSGFDCSPNPMRVCAEHTDPLGNVCNWIGCGYESRSSEFFGGCAGNTTAGTLCCPPPSPCAGPEVQRFGAAMAGCGGSVTFENRASLCAPGCSPCTAGDWMARVYEGQVPTHSYWVNDLLRVEIGSDGVCSVAPAETSCFARVCPSGVDTSGNECGAVGGCRWPATLQNGYFGGCGGGHDTRTAGTLCCCP